MLEFWRAHVIEVLVIGALGTGILVGATALFYASVLPRYFAAKRRMQRITEALDLLVIHADSSTRRAQQMADMLRLWSESRNDEAERLLLTSEIEEGTDKEKVAYAYDRLSRLWPRHSEPNVLQAIRAVSHALSLQSKSEFKRNLSELLLHGHREPAVQTLRERLAADLVQKWLTGEYDENSELEKEILKVLTDSESITLKMRAYLRLSELSVRESVDHSGRVRGEPDYPAALQAQKEAWRNYKIACAGAQSENWIDVALVITEDYAPHAAVTILSALMNSNFDTRYRFRVVMDPNRSISNAAREKLLSICGLRDCEISFIPMQEELAHQVLGCAFEDLFGTNVEPPWTKLTMYRLLLHRLFDDCDKLLYLDSDTVVLSDLKPLFDKVGSGSGKWVAAAVDRPPFAFAFGRVGRQDLSYDLRYFNTGVLVLALRAMRESGADDELSKTVREVRARGASLGYADQDLANLSFRGRVEYVSNRWNSASWCVDREVGRDKLLGNSFAPFIIHYMGSKPWSADRVELWRRTGRQELGSTERVYWGYRQLGPWPSVEQ